MKLLIRGAASWRVSKDERLMVRDQRKKRFLTMRAYRSRVTSIQKRFQTFNHARGGRRPRGVHLLKVEAQAQSKRAPDSDRATCFNLPLVVNFVFLRLLAESSASVSHAMGLRCSVCSTAFVGLRNAFTHGTRWCQPKMRP